MKINTIIFDWAGTTVDYGCMAPVKAFEKAFADVGIDLSPDQIREPMGMLKIDHIKALLEMSNVKKAWHEHYGRASEDSDIQKIYAAFENYLFEDLAENSTLKPDTLEVFNTLKEKGFNIGSTTGYTKEMMTVVAKEAEKFGYKPDFVATPDDVQSIGRPYPYMIFENMKYFGTLSVNEVVKVGDTVSDIKEGKNAGVYTIAVIEGSSELGLSFEEYQRLSVQERENLVEKAATTFYSAGADNCILTLSELIPLVLEPITQAVH
ncbi:phosphonoacetaldehyde hydrolase [Candidatus Enterococcus clewellii]|uniref:Phosphonoacetaldehyde hydrolase n=1 Tax=Candidatus Enterococcus clewellii TaxID=1834193 RepID=A0A242K1D5_9ENTE|nr:phosphonoacetaldehyde hydrolase [Enterococcus sp. 9E7_DIV0242]OTP11471.1 phosphonoacetaldehyde hydrolase [Enterococcus sp. 9E7_DIV0242]